VVKRLVLKGTRMPKEWGRVRAAAAVARSQILIKFQSPILGRPAIDWAALVAAAEPGYIRKKPPSNASMRNDVFIVSRMCGYNCNS
jgi:hypothetical protein